MDFSGTQHPSPSWANSVLVEGKPLLRRTPRPQRRFYCRPADAEYALPVRDCSPVTPPCEDGFNLSICRASRFANCAFHDRSPVIRRADCPLAHPENRFHRLARSRSRSAGKIRDNPPWGWRGFWEGRIERSRAAAPNLADRVPRLCVARDQLSAAALLHVVDDRLIQEFPKNRTPRRWGS